MKVKVTAHDEIIVTDLRPMSDAPRDGGTFLVMHANYDELVPAYWSDYYQGFIHSPGCIPDQDGFLGWITLPKYQP